MGNNRLFIGHILLAATASFVAWRYQLAPAMPVNDKATVFSTLGQIAGTMLGFMLATLAILASINDADLVKKMRDSGHYDELSQTIFAGCFLFLIATVVSVWFLFVDGTHEIMMSVLVGSYVGAILVLLVVGWQFWLTLRNLTPIQENPSEMPSLK